MAGSAADNPGMQPGPEAPPLWQYDPYVGRRRKQWLKKALVTTLLVAGAAMPFMPATIRVHLPGGMKLHIPRIEFVRDSVPGQPAEAPIEAGMIGGDPAVQVDAIPRDPEPSERRSAHKPSRRAHFEARRAEVEDPPNVTYVPDHPVTIVPVKVRTEVRLAPRGSRGVEHTDAAVLSPDRDLDDEADDPGASRDDWPILCGKVVNVMGAPISGARVELESPPVAVYTEADGRFCVVCPRGERTLRVEADGHTPATRILDVRGNNFEMRVMLAR